jgi:hypothetical protein
MFQPQESREFGTLLLFSHYIFLTQNKVLWIMGMIKNENY